MNIENVDKLILSIIRANLTNERLVLGLIDLRIADQANYSIDLAESVLTLMGFDDPKHEFVNEYYALQISRVREVNLETGVHGMRIMAQSVYDDLLRFKAFKDGLSANNFPTK